MNLLEVGLTLSTFLLNSFLGLFVFYRNKKNWTNRLFLILTFFINLYLGVNYFSLHPIYPTPSNQLFLIRLVMFVTSFIGPILLILVHTFPKDKITMSRLKLLVLLLLCLLSATFSLLPLVFSSIEYPNGQPVPVPGPGIGVFFIDFVGLFIFSFFLLLHKYKKSFGIEKNQIQYFLIGIILTFSLMAISTVIFVVILKFSGLVFLGPNSVLLLIAFVAYAIVKHRFLDIRLVVARSVAYALLVIILGLIYGASFFIVATLISGETIQISSLITSIILALIMALSFQPLLRILEKITNKIFYQQIYNSNDLLWSLSLIMASKLVLSDLTESILKALFAQMKISHGYLVLLQKGSIIWLKAEGIEKAPEFNEAKVGTLLEEVMKKEAERLLVFEELADSEVKNIMREYNISIVLPLVVDNVGIGVLLFGEKSSGDIYSIEDIDVFKILSPEIAIAVRNSLSYEEIKRFNITLEEEVKRATSELQLANEKLKMLDKLKDEFVSLASHELRTPMTAIKSYLWMALAGKGGELSEKQKYYLSRSYQSTERLINLVNDMLNVSRIESGRITLVFAGVPMMTLTQEVFEELHPRAQELGVNLVMSESKGLPDVVADSDKIKQVLINLLGNALKFTPKDGTITVSFTEKDGMITTQVTDTGEGIAKEDQPKLFQKFGMVGNNYLTRQNTQGTGLGLFISKKIIEMHGGKIWVESEGIGKGTTFTFSLQPFSKEVQEKMQKLQEKQEAPVVKS